MKKTLIAKIYSRISRRTISFLISFSLIIGSMLSGVGPFEAFVDRALADSGQGNAVKVYGYTFYNERQYIPFEMVEGEVKSVGGTAGFDTIDVCTNGRHNHYGVFSGAGGGIGGAMAGSSFVTQGNTQFTLNNYYYSNQYVGNGHATLWVPENPKVTSRVLEANVCKLDTYEFPSPYGHEYRFNPKGSEYLFSMMTPVLRSGDVFIQKAYYNIVETGECYISRPPTPGSMWLLHHYYENCLAYPLLFMYYDNENDAKNAVYSEPVPLRGANCLCYIDTLEDGKSNIGKFTEKPGCDFYNAASVYFGEIYDNTSYPYRNREAYIINVYPPNNPKKFTPENPQDITGQLIRLHGTISRETIILPDMTMPYLNVDYYSISYNGISVNRIKREREDTFYAEDDLPHQLPSELEIDGESVYVDSYEVIGLPTAEDPTLSLKVNETRVAHNDSHVTKYEKIDDTYHHKVCTYNGCAYEEARKKHTFGDWIIDTPATENSKGRRHKTCTVEGCGYSTPVEEFDFVNGNEIDLSSVFEKVDSEVGNREPVYINSDSQLKMTSTFLSNMRETVDAYNTANNKSYGPIENVVLALYEDENQLSRSGYGSATDQRGMYTGRRQSGYSEDCYYARTYENNDESNYGHSKIVLSKKIQLNDSINSYYNYLGGIVGNDKVDGVKAWYENAKTKQWKVVYGSWNSDAYYFCAVLTNIPKTEPGQEEEIPPHEHNIAVTLSGNDLSQHWVYCKKDDRAAENDPSSCTFEPYFEEHTFGEWKAGTTANGHARKHFRKCAQCGYEEEGEHVAVSENGVDKYFCLTESSVDTHFKSCCICGEKMEKENCSYGDWETVTPATHKHEGIQVKTCSVCGHIKDDLNRIPKIDHTWSESWSADDDHHWHKCTSENCVSDDSVYKDKAEHRFTVLTQLTDVVKKDNYHSAACSVCGKSIEHAHTWEKDEAGSSASTCTVSGENVFICACSAEKRETLPLAEHDYEERTTKEPTCTETGTKSQVCKVCGHSENDVPIDALGHDFVSAWSHDETGHWHKCSRAAENDDTHPKESIDAHSYEWKSDGSDHWKECTVCGYVDESSKTTHTYGNWSDDGNAGHKHNCTVCSHSETVAHSYNSDPDNDQTKTYDSTCTETGLKTWTCMAADCGHTKTETIPAKDHDFQAAWVNDADGHWHACSRANGDTDHARGSYSAHSMVTKFDDNDHWQECSVCGYNEDGAVTRTAHTAGSDWIKDGAEHWHKCTDCDFRMDIAAHDVDPDEAWVSGNAISHYHTCTICGGHADEEAHTYGDWTVTKEATENEAGSRQRTCAVCGYVNIEEIAKLTKRAEETNNPVPPPSNTITAETKNVVLVTKNAYSITGGMTPVASSGKKNGNPYTVGNPKILKIDKNGKITVKKAGTTTISFMTADGETHTVTVTVEKPKKQNQTITDPNTTELEAKSLLKGASYSEPDSVTSTKSNVATVDANGKIHIKGKGKTKIKYKFGKLKVNSTLKVKVDPNPEAKKTDTAKTSETDAGLSSESDTEISSVNETEISLEPDTQDTSGAPEIILEDIPVEMPSDGEISEP